MGGQYSSWCLVRVCTCYLKYILRAVVVSNSCTSISLQTLGLASMSVVTKRVTINKASQDERSTHELGLNFLNKFSQSGVAVHVCSRQPLGLSSHRAAAGRICKVWWFQFVPHCRIGVPRCT